MSLSRRFGDFSGDFSAGFGGLGGLGLGTERIVVVTLEPDPPSSQQQQQQQQHRIQRRQQQQQQQQRKTTERAREKSPTPIVSPVVDLDSLSSASDGSSSNYCDQLCTNVSIVSDLVECASRRGGLGPDLGGGGGDLGGRTTDAMLLHGIGPGLGDLSPTAAQDFSDSERSSFMPVEPWRPKQAGLSGDRFLFDSIPHDLVEFDQASSGELTPGADEDLQSPLPLQDPVAVPLPPPPDDWDRQPEPVPIAGYEHAKYHRNSIPALITPPVGDEVDIKRCPVRLPEEDMASVGYITEDEAQQALVDLVSATKCYGRSAARDMDIYRIVPSSALHYTLETFTESRSTSWDQEPYTGQRIDGPSNGPAPLPWDIRCNPVQMFHTETRFVEVPHTATIACCYACSAVGWSRCQSCLGRGFKRCISCCGSGRLWKTDPHGHRHVDSCWHCHGTGRKRCTVCSGDGRVVCRICQGYRNLKCFIKLRVEYTNNFSEYVIERTDLPKEFIKEVSGEVILNQTQPKVWPITDYPEEELCIASQNLVQQHVNRARNTRILMQRQKLRVIAVSECTYGWNDFDGRFWVYGREMAVYAPDYPQKHCWGCTIL